MAVTWLHNGTIAPPNEVLTAGNTTTLVIRNPQSSDAGVYQCVFNYRGWILRRIISGSYIFSAYSYSYPITAIAVFSLTDHACTLKFYTDVTKVYSYVHV